MEFKSSKTEYRMGLDRFLMSLPVYLVVFFLGFFAARSLGLKDLDPFFGVCYLVVFLGITSLCHLQKRSQWQWIILLFTFAMMALMFRDMVLILNMGLALLCLFLGLLLANVAQRNLLFPIFTLISSIFWLIQGIDEKIVAVSLILGILMSVAMLMKREVEFQLVVLIFLLGIVFLPDSKKPMQWKGVKAAYKGVTSFVSRSVKDISFWVSDIFDWGNGSSYSGYNDTGKLHDEVVKSDNVEMRFVAQSKSKTIHLKGADYKTLSKNGWSGKDNFGSGYKAWFVEYINALMDADITAEEARSFSRLVSAEAKFRYLRTEDLIHPTYTIRVSDRYKDGFDEEMSKGTAYAVSYLDVDYANPYFQRVIAFAQENYGANASPIRDREFHTYQEARDYVKATYQIKLENDMSEAEYNAYASQAGQEATEYLDTSMATERVKDLAKELTGKCDNDYERAKVIEAYLRELTYDTDVDLTKEENFVDAFLFEKKRGYCVHFASSMVVMLRSIGIPARFCSGYSYETGAKNVKGSDAHAWVEAYIRGVGWIVFEPTASSQSAEDKAWGITVKSEKDKEVDWEKYYQEKLKEKNNASLTDAEKAEMMAKRAKEIEEREKEKQRELEEKRKREAGENQLTLKVFLKILGYMGVFIVIIAALVACAFLGRKIWFNRLSAERKLQENVKRRLARIEKKIEDKEVVAKLRSNDSSIYEYLDYVDESEKEELKKMFDTYYRVRFRGDKL